MRGEGTLAGLFARGLFSAGMAPPIRKYVETEMAGIMRRPPRWSRTRMA
jgi:hypothetical protein